MKDKYLDTVVRFLADQAPMIRFYNRQWWMIQGGYWVKGGRETLQGMVVGYFRAFAPPLLARDLNQADLNQITSFLARKFYSPSLPARAVAPEDDEKMILWDVRPKPRLGSE